MIRLEYVEAEMYPPKLTSIDIIRWDYAFKTKLLKAEREAVQAAPY